MDFARLFTIAISAVFVNNFVLARFLGLCPFIGISKRLETSIGMGLAVIFVMSVCSAITWPIYHFILLPYHFEFLYIVTFILVIASFVQLVEMIIRNKNPFLYRALGIYLPLITTNCAVMGVALLNVKKGLTLLEGVVNGFSAGVGFSLVLILMTAIRERLDLADIPESLQGVPVAFIVVGLLSLAFFGFTGLIVQ